MVVVETICDMGEIGLGGGFQRRRKGEEGLSTLGVEKPKLLKKKKARKLNDGSSAKQANMSDDAMPDMCRVLLTLGRPPQPNCKPCKRASKPA